MAREGDGMNGRCPHCQRDLVAVAPLVEPIVDQRPWIDQDDRAVSRFQSRKRHGRHHRFELPPSLRQAA
jgi:hypothetical protein